LGSAGLRPPSAMLGVGFYTGSGFGQNQICRILTCFEVYAGFYGRVGLTFLLGVEHNTWTILRVDAAPANLPVMLPWLCERCGTAPAAYFPLG
jgi:hypothetical protein